MEGPPLGPGGEDITWPDQVAPRGQKASSTRKIKPQTSNHHCSPCFLVAKPGSTALRLVVDYGEVNKKTQNHSGSIPNIENSLERIDAFPWGACPRDAAADTRKQAGRQSTSLTRASSCSCHVTKRFRILATLKQGNKSMYSNTSGYVHMGLRLDWGKGITGQ